jgi:hypothetical protein
MALDSKYVAAYSFEEVILDKDNAAPLADGLVYFYKDTARSQLKDIFQLTTSPTYTYVALPNPVKLSSIGTFQDNSGNDVVPYFYPYDANGNVELYYVEFYSSLDGITPAVFQFSREAVPSSAVASTVNEETEIKNYIPDGQFLIHNDIPPTNTTVQGQVTQDTTILSQGGWTYERSIGSSARDFVQFNAITSAVTVPTGNPKNTCNVICFVPDVNDAFKGLRVRFYDVNKFASDTQEYTISFYAKSNSGNNFIDVNLIKNFGTGGSPDPSTSTPIITNVAITPTFQIFNYSFVFGTNIGKTLGTNGDDYVQIDFSLPPTSAFNMEFTDFALVLGNLNLTSFPVMTNEEMLYRSLAGWFPVPNPDGSDLYLPTMLTPTGLAFDHSVVGKIESCGYNTNNIKIGELFCDGSQYPTLGYSSDGIPYARLQKVLWNSTLQVPIFGTGLNYFIGTFAGTDLSSGAELIVTNNIYGASTSASDGSIPTGFTFSSITTGNSFAYDIANFCGTPNTIFIQSPSQTYGNLNCSAGTSGFTVYNVIDGGGHNVKCVDALFTTVAAGLAGKYFTVSNGVWYFWFKVDGSGSDPHPGGTGTQINLHSYDGANVVGIKVAAAINGKKCNSIITTAGSSVTAGSYFNIYSSNGTASIPYYVWYQVNGVGTDPAVSGATGIKVNILSTDNNSAVASKTQDAINMQNFAVPDLRGMFLRGVGGQATGLDPQNRVSPIPGINGDSVGDFEYFSIQQHIHSATVSPSNPFQEYVAPPAGNTGNVGSSGYQNSTISVSIGYTGSQETVPINTYVMYVIKY